MSKVIDLLGDKAGYYLDHTCKTIDKSLIYVPSPDTIDKIWVDSDRNIKVLNSLQAILGHGRLANSGYVSILPVDQDIEHTAGASFAPNPIYFDPENIVKLAIEGGCNAVASTFGILGAVARKYAHKIPFVVKLNHNELLTYPNSYDQVKKHGIWELRLSALLSISVRNKVVANWWKSLRLSSMLTNWGWPLSCGVICVIVILRKMVWIIMLLPT